MTRLFRFIADAYDDLMGRLTPNPEPDPLELCAADLLADLERMETRLIRAQDIDLDTPAQAAGRWVGRGWSGEGS